MPAISISNRTIVSSKAEVEHFERGQTLVNIVNTTEATDESVQLDRPNRTGIQNPSIRYIKNGKCKVQYDDGRFEWVGEDNVDFCEGKILEHSDHSGYHACNSSVEDESSAVHGSTTQVKRQHTTNSSFAAAPSPPKRRSTVQTPNFCCPVCDRKVYQKEPSYIVIRLPACDDCTKERMIVLDERTKRVGVHSIQK
ncbi:hypothetical protein DICVIV_04464 [Dictyocaulus viviparus]|uniref:Uncharacterized protein n=1 Tax=Dictyocaulus viviparus TaxID=29172 RepID=A0A0D8Y488_DICVI|nr:hypothetical protein DICVIV_04464 [Dictyocaulus viviparus]